MPNPTAPNPTAKGPATILDMDPSVWQAELGLSDEECPVAIISEGSWWRAQRCKWRLGYLDQVRELAFPDMFWGIWQGHPVLYCCAYGASRAVEFAHIGACLGADLLLQIGTCGGLQAGLGTGDIVIPERAACHEGVARFYGESAWAASNSTWAKRAEDDLTSRGHNVRVGSHLTWVSIFAQTNVMVRNWQKEGYLSVDMETATTLAVARHFGKAGLSLLVVWDELLKDRSFLDPLPQDAQKRLDQANQSVYECALSLVTHASRSDSSGV